MTYEKLLKLLTPTLTESPWEKLKNPPSVMDALREVVKLHKPFYDKYLHGTYCDGCMTNPSTKYPCETIQVIQKQLK